MRVKVGERNERRKKRRRIKRRNSFEKCPMCDVYVPVFLWCGVHGGEGGKGRGLRDFLCPLHFDPWRTLSAYGVTRCQPACCRCRRFGLSVCLSQCMSECTKMCV